MADSDKEKTVVICPNGLFQYRRMPFGLTNEPATFQRLMATLFNGKEWPFVFIYLDDICTDNIQVNGRPCSTCSKGIGEVK